MPRFNALDLAVTVKPEGVSGQIISMMRHVHTRVLAQKHIHMCVLVCMYIYGGCIGIFKCIQIYMYI